ncbi:3-carboxy-cis,cis-muconate cycloisomerase [Saccharomonospora amisosensis]|uniref:3-carboxy-cis,cis-muconate cycloisomerase n=1 Tax=Saccharomonospora amisosensis TaxID=1128677 RepID=A0A7X5ZSD0_9PSEU|nr:adenylosuccinate lyase family protein [Saccharomonospora amisosensis]NIJ13210.1 3-carboxy-cis,cis-muconate cycloisomerase [Saccharomonospora amisosensis]
MSELFDPVLAAGPVSGQVDDAAWLHGMLDFEAALAGAQADVGLLDPAHARRIGEVCQDASFDIAELGNAATGIGNPAGPLVRALTERVGGAAARHVHAGATSQDVLDTSAMLVSARALESLLGELDAAAAAAARLAAEHAETVQVGRTLSQHALPVTFGFTAAGWLSALDASGGRLRAVRLPAQLGGAVGTLASLGTAGPEVLAALARRLGLSEPVLPWHTDRTPVAELACALGEVAGAVSAVARSVVLLAQTDVGEVHEQGPEGSGGSSTMPHKRNPVAAVSALACAKQAPGLVADLLATMEQEHQRAAGAWHAEWQPLTQLWRVCGSAVYWLRTSLERLRVDADRMRENLDRGGGVLLAERVTTELAPSVGRLAAHDAVTGCCRRALDGEGTVAELLAADPLVAAQLSRARIDELLDPSGYLGSAVVFVERSLAAHRARKEEV